MNKNQNENDFDFESARELRQETENPYARSYNADNAQRGAENGRRVYEPQQSRRKVRKHQSEFGFNWGALIFLLIIAAVIVVSVVQIKKNPTKEPEPETEPPLVYEDDENGGQTDMPDDGTVPDEPVKEDETEESGKTEDRGNTDTTAYPSYTVEANFSEIDEFELVLVNYDHDYSENADCMYVINTYEKRTSHFKVAGTNIRLSPLAFEAFEEMVNGLENATGCDDLIINSGYRTLTDQQEIYDYYLDSKGAEYVNDYVANPGESEHHTGLALDLSFYLDEGYTENVGIHEHGAWLAEHCTDYGFIIRYPEDKVEFTHIAYEPWHFRYVGEVHAKAMKSLGKCLEEYITLLEDCTLGEKVLYLSSDGKAALIYTDSIPKNGGYIIYSVKANESGKTEMPIYGEEGAEYSYSGTNDGAFVVTVPLG